MITEPMPVRDLTTLSEDECARKTLVVIDPSQNFEEIAYALALLDTLLADEPLVLVPSKRYETLIADGLSNFGCEIDHRLVQYKTVNADYDSMLYKQALVMGVEIFNIVRSCQRQGIGTTREFDPRFEVPFSIAMHDRFISQMRPVMEIREACSTRGIDQVIHFGRPSQLGRAISEALVTLLDGVRVITTLDHTPARARAYHSRFASSSSYPQRSRMYPLPLPPADLPPVDRGFVVGTNLRDKQYRKTSLPVVLDLLEVAPVTLLDSAQSDLEAALREFDLEGPLGSGELQILEKSRAAAPTTVHAEDAKLVSVATRRFDRFLQSAPGFFPGFAPMLVAYLREQMLPVVWNLDALVGILEPHAKAARRVVVSPGRTFEAGVLVQLARKHFVPSVEIQSGTISRSHRFTRPQADYVLAIEDFSKRVYGDFLGFPHERIVIVGGPKLELEIAPVRSLTRGEVRSSLGAPLGIGPEDTVVLFASQPVGTDRMEAVFRTVAEGLALSRAEATILIKPHPNEDEVYLSHYRALAREYGVSLVIDRDMTALEAVKLSDLVVTYYSTVGLEAFALGRHVIAVNPFSFDSPYDLSELGVAHEAKDPEVFAFLVDSWMEDGWPRSTADSTIGYLQDGLTMPRTLDFITSDSLSVLRDDTPELPDGRLVTTVRRLAKLRDPAFVLSKLRMRLGAEV